MPANVIVYQIKQRHYRTRLNVSGEYFIYFLLWVLLYQLYFESLQFPNGGKAIFKSLESTRIFGASRLCWKFKDNKYRAYFLWPFSFFSGILDLSDGMLSSRERICYQILSDEVWILLLANYIVIYEQAFLRLCL